MLKRFALFIFGFFIIILIVFWGFKSNFPGKSIARAVKINFTKQTGIPVEIRDFELEWLKVSTPEIALFKPKWITGNAKKPLLVLENIESPLNSILSNGKTIIYSKVHGGNLTASNYIFSNKPLEVSLEKVRLEDVPVITLIPNTSLSGVISLSAQIRNFETLQKQNSFLPEGSLKGSINSAKIKFNGSTNLLGIQFPELDFSNIIFDMEFGPSILIKKIELQGTIDGIIEGSIKINENRPQMSLIDLNLELVLSPVIREKFRSISPMLLSFQCDQTININIKGSISHINFPTKNKC